jgi:uncharacterized protein YkwD
MRRKLGIVAASVIVVAIAVLSFVWTTRALIPRTGPLAIVAEHDGLVEVRDQVVDNTNRLRKRNGLRPLDMTAKLNSGAQDHSDYMARTRNFVHSDDLQFQMTQAYDGTWSYAGENIGVFGGDLSELLAALRQSPEHRANMLKPQYRRIGVGATWDSDNARLWLTVWFEG